MSDFRFNGVMWRSFCQPNVYDMAMRLLATVLIIATGLYGADTRQFRAGAFAADITPQQWPVRLIGNFEQPVVSQAHDPLHARAVVLDDGQKKLAIVVVDSCYVARALYDRAKQRASKATGIPASHMLMSATHTHSAPPAKPEGATAVELAYQERLEAQIVDAVVRAHSRLQPAQIGWAVRNEPSELNNRRWWMAPGTIPPDPFGGLTDKVQMNPPRASPNLIKPAGPIDPGFTVVSIRKASGEPLAVLANYSLHYVGGVPANQVSADYFGEFARQLGEALRAEKAGPEFVGILSNGTSGDVNNIDFRHPAPPLAPFEKIRQVADKLSANAVAAYRETKFQNWVALGAEEQELPLQYRKPMPERIEQARRFLAEPDANKLPRHAKAYAERVLKLHDGPETADVKLQAIHIGDLGIAAIPFEVFTEIGLEIKAKSPFATTFTMELANGHYGYLPTPEQHELGGYETWMGTNLVEREASRKITTGVLGLLGKLADSAPAIKPESTIRLFDGKSLDAFQTWLVNFGHSDPEQVFTVVDRVDGAPAIRVSGKHWGGLLTKRRYRDYKLIVEYRWGPGTWGDRKDRARDNGILLHAQGRPGNSQKDFNGPWMRSVEFQIIEGGVGDFILVGGYTDAGELLRPTLKARSRKDRDGETVFDAKGEAKVYSQGRINWWGRSEDWADRIGFRGPQDPDSPGQEWTRLEAIVAGDRLTYYVNGKLVNEGFESSLTEGKLLFQSEGAELYFRRIDLEPLP